MFGKRRQTTNTVALVLRGGDAVGRLICDLQVARSIPSRSSLT